MSDLLKNFIEKMKQKEAFADFDSVMAGMKERLPAREGASGSSLIAWQLYEYARDNFYMMLVIERKLSEIAKGLDSALLANNMSVFLTLSRSFFEHTASLVYQDELLGKALAEFPKKHGDEAIFAAIADHSARLKKLYYSSAKNGEKVHVNKMIAVIEAKDSDLGSRYEDLCEFVHPNYGSNKLVSSGILGEGHLGTPENVFIEERSNAMKTLLKCMLMIEDSQMSLGRCLIELDTRIRIASEGVRSTQIFVDKLDYSGDGKSKETALVFKRARTPFEAMKAFYDYVEKNRLTFKKPPSKLIEAGWIYETYDTNKGVLWVKFIMKL